MVELGHRLYGREYEDISEKASWVEGMRQLECHTEKMGQLPCRVLLFFSFKAM